MNWHPMTPEDLPAVNDIADQVHVNYPEDASVFAERLRLYPKGCFILNDDSCRTFGYLISHPWLFKKPPELNALLGRIPSSASTYYVHDIALLQEARGTGMASIIIRKLIEHAKMERLPSVSLVAVNNSAAFWKAHDFKVVVDHSLDQKLKSYDDQAAFMVRELAP